MKLPKRIRLGLPQKLHGRPAHRLYSWQQEWLEARQAEHVKLAWARHKEHLAELQRMPATTLVELMERRLAMAEANIGFHLETSIYYGVELNEMPRNPPTGDGKG